MPLLLVVILALASALSAAGQRAEASVFVGLSQVRDNALGTLPGGEALRLEDGFRVGARVGINRGAFAGHELSYGFERHDLKADDEPESTARVQQLHYNFLLHLTPQKVAVRPFVTAGTGLSRYSTDGEGAGRSKLGVNYGGGLKLRMGKAVGARFDVRDHVNGKPALADAMGLRGRLHSVEYSAGFSLLF